MADIEPSDSTTRANESALPPRPWLHALALLVVGATFLLIAIGGNVTSLDAGMAFPSGWFTGDYWSLLAPLGEWWHNVAQRWEHSHRLQGYLVGNLFIVLVVWLWLRETWLAKQRGEQRRLWLAIVGTFALGLVVAQGVLGAARVDWNSTLLALIHGINGQLILALTVLIAAATGKTWLRLVREPGRPPVARRSAGRFAAGLRLAAWGLLAVMVMQLILGAAVRHTGATLAIPDFPTTYGRVLPPTSEHELNQAWAASTPNPPARSNRPATISRAQPDETSTAAPYTLMQVHLHFAHRVMAGVLVVWALALAVALALKAPRRELLAPRTWLLTLLAVQIMLGALVIWESGYPAIATAHQATGAALLAVATWLALRVHLVTRFDADAVATAPPQAVTTPPAPAQGSPA